MRAGKLGSDYLIGVRATNMAVKMPMPNANTATAAANPLIDSGYCNRANQVLKPDKKKIAHTRKNAIVSPS